jgi:LCP family protein required for cell wall assembly
MAKSKTKKKNSKLVTIYKVIGIICTILIGVFLVFLGKLNILPGLYFGLLLGVLTFLSMLSLFAIFKFKKGLKIMALIVLFLFGSFSVIGCYYLYHTDAFLNQSFRNRKSSYTTVYYLVSAKASSLENISSITSSIGYYSGSSLMEEAMQNLRSRGGREYSFVPYDDVVTMFQNVLAQNIPVMLVEQTNYNLVFDISKDLDREQFKVLEEVKFDTEIDSEVAQEGKTFNIYVGGNDFTNSLMDFNMIVTVNMDRHQVLMTSFPRDYYIPVAGFEGKKDTLSFMGARGVETNRKSLEEFLGIDLGYYVKIQTHSLVGIVDEIGGIEYCSDISFTTTHAKILDDYNDKHGEKMYVSRGCHHFNGIETLTVARERLAFPGGDRQRQKNCQQIIKAIFKQLLSTNTITNYNNILNSLSNLYQTNIPRELITDLIKETINGANWEFKEQSVNGTDGENFVHLTNLRSYVMNPDMNTVNAAIEEIKAVLN